MNYGIHKEDQDLTHYAIPHKYRFASQLFAHYKCHTKCRQWVVFLTILLDERMGKTQALVLSALARNTIK